ncbi:anti-sigma factor family protein [Fimbriiglobus ruber]|uniref:Putative zinc-finger domain-containing protein n=1 Tax=Fimbriiglobus ruber TaxID=1908690 RepID=A0A225DRA5_9BACT|nr:zf-HC2 domain-containing protein [Fimbriiglobus ruber]OWK43623.1 hypothetical protein FRUB_03222 [Fimbriiglobus ruber]
MNLSCQDVTDLLAEIFDRSLPVEVQTFVERHVHTCPDCGHRVDTYRATVVISRSLPKCDRLVPLPPAFEERLRTLLRHAESRQC